MFSVIFYSNSRIVIDFFFVLWLVVVAIVSLFGSDSIGSWGPVDVSLILLADNNSASPVVSAGFNQGQ
jgi:hypothetical protein